MEKVLGEHWHHVPEEEVIGLLGTDIHHGLDTFEVHHRLERFGPNVLTPRQKTNPLLRFLLQFHSPLIYILLVAGTVTLFLKGMVDALIIYGVVLVNAIVGFIQESRAEKAIETLAQTMTTETTVIRSAKLQRISAANLVPGDVVVLNAGDKVPADIRLVHIRDLQVAEAALTGESVPVHKHAGVQLPPETSLADRHNMAYASTLVTYGQGTGIVIATGDQTEVGRISQLIASADVMETPLTRKINHFSHVLLYVILALAGATFLMGIWRGQSVTDTFLAAVALAVGAIPEGLPAAVTITLAIGVSRMAQRRAIIRKLPAVETLGSVTVIGSDKTGTLTQNQMTVQQIMVPGARYDVVGTGYAPAGHILHQGAEIDTTATPGLRECLIAGLLCNDSMLVFKDNRWEAEGDPTEAALIAAAGRGKLSVETFQTEFPRLDTIPFESQHQYMATLHDAGCDQPPRIYFKGATEVTLNRCMNALDVHGQIVALDTPQILDDLAEMASRGLRVLAFARGTLPPGTTTLSHDDVSRGLTFLGLQAMIDPPRIEAITAVRACQSAGIRVKMITGDHALTAAAIARQLGLGDSNTPDGMPVVLTGKEMATLSDEQMIQVVEETAVFARVSPEQKLRLVEAMQARNHIVAMTGDGVNDAPALKQADIGIAMGITGTDVAKETADMVLTDDNFASIEAAVEEGRGVFDNLTKFITWTLPTNVGEGLIILVAIFLGIMLPILPAQILWINMTTAIALGITLAMEPKEPGIMQRPPRPTQAPILSAYLIGRVVVVGTLMAVGAFGLFQWEVDQGTSLDAARTVAVNVVVFVELFYLFNCRSLSYSMFQIGVFSNMWVVLGVTSMIVLQVLFTYVPFMNQTLGSAPIGLAAWGRILGIGLAIYIFVEIEKWIVPRLMRPLPRPDDQRYERYPIQSRVSAAVSLALPAISSGSAGTNLTPTPPVLVSPPSMRHRVQSPHQHKHPVSAVIQLLVEKVVHANVVTGVVLSNDTLVIQIDPVMEPFYQRPDSDAPVAADPHTSQEFVVQGLGVQGRAVRYHIRMLQLGYTNDAGQFSTFSLPIAGIDTDLGVTNEVVERIRYLLLKKKLSPQVAAALLREFYQVELTVADLERWQARSGRNSSALATTSS